MNKRAGAGARADEKMFFDLFSPNKMDAFARTLASDVARRYPPAVANDPHRTISPARLTAVLEEIFSSAHRYIRENHLGILRKAMLCHIFQWLLRELGYDEEFIDTAAKLLRSSLIQPPDPALGRASKPDAVE